MIFIIVCLLAVFDENRAQNMSAEATVTESRLLSARQRQLEKQLDEAQKQLVNDAFFAGLVLGYECSARGGSKGDLTNFYLAFTNHQGPAPVAAWLKAHP